MIIRIISLLAVFLVCLPTVFSQSIDVELDVTRTNDLNVTDHGDGSFSLSTTGNDPWIRSKPLSEYDHTSFAVLSFEYKSENGLDDFQLFFGPPIDAQHQISIGAFQPADTWKTIKVFFEYETELWTKAYTDFRFDFGRQSGQSITVRNIELREMTTEDTEDLQESDVYINEQFLDYLSKDFSSEINEVVVKADKVVVKGRIDDSEDDLYLCEVKPWQYGFNDKNFDNSWILSGSGDFIKEFDRTTEFNGKQDDRIYSRWVLASKEGDDFVLQSHMKFPTDVFDAAEAYPREDMPSSIKGLGGIGTAPEQYYDLVDLGISNITRNVVLNGVISTETTSLSHDFNGKTYYFNRNYVERIDQLLTFCDQKDIIVSFILLLPNGMTGEKRTWFIHPDATDGIYALPNLNSELGMEYYRATIDFLVKRYSRPDKKYGRVSRFIMHNEIDAHYVWTDAGDKPMPLYAELYQRSARMVYYTARKYNPHAKVFASFTKHWTQPHTSRAYKPADFLDVWNDLGKKQGDFEWGVAFHPYPENLSVPEVWDNTNITYNFNTPEITGKNVEVIDAWMRKKENLFKGQKVRTLLFSEQGVHTRSYNDYEQSVQAAGVAYYWKKIKELPSLEAFHYHRWIDHPNEGNLLFGLWTNAENTLQEFGEKKISWDVYQAAGTNAEDDVFEFCKSIIDINSWSEIKATVFSEVTPFTIEFVVKSDGLPIADAVVEFSGTKKITNDNGLATFYNVASLQDLQYHVFSEEEGSVKGKVNVDAAEKVEVDLASDVGIKNNMDEGLDVYPNPVDDILYIHHQGAAISKIEILDLSGRVIREQEMNASREQIHLSGLLPGNYLVKILVDNHVFVKKILKQ